MSTALRRIVDPFVVAAPGGARVRTRLRLDEADAGVLWAVGTHLGSLAGHDLAARCREGKLAAGAKAHSRRERKRALTARCSARWAGAITRTSEDAWGLARRNLEAEAVSLRARCNRISQRLKVPVGERQGKTRGYATQNERWLKQCRLQVLQARLADVDARLAAGRVSIVRGGKALARKRNNLDASGMSPGQWQAIWAAERLFITADGEADKRLGNETIRWDPTDRGLEIKLPAALSHLANRAHGRYRLSCAVDFSYSGDEVAAQAESGAVRYDISFDPAKARWYLDASWKTKTGPPPCLDELRRAPVLAVDLNAGHLAAWVLGPDGNPLGQPITVPLDLAGLSITTRDARLRSAVSGLLHIAKTHGCRALVIEDLGFTEARAVDPAYTSRWGAQHWLGPLHAQFSSEVSGHHAAAYTIGRRGLGQRARRRARCGSNPTEDGQERATDSAGRPIPTTVGLSEPAANREPGDRKARGQPIQGRKTRPARRPPPGHQVAQDRSGLPTGQDSLLLSVQER